MDKAKFEKYAQLKLEEKSIQAQIKALAPEIVREIGTADKVASDYGTFTIEHRKVYTYSDKVKEAEATVKNLQAEEKADGTATSVEVKTLKFFAKKEEV